MAKSSLRLMTEMTEMTEIVHANAASEVVSDFSMPSLVKVQNAGGGKKHTFPVTRLCTKSAETHLNATGVEIQ